jgi:hypothetical protein
VAPLYFYFSEFHDELSAIDRFARDFIRYDSLNVLSRLRRDLENARRARNGQTVPWTIPSNAPLRSRTSEGRFLPSGRGARRVFGEITSIWEIQPVRERGREQQPANVFSLAGKVSTRVGIRQVSPDRRYPEIAMWRMEIGDESSPGPCFHIQVLGQSNRVPFPRDLEIPRLPTIMFTPMLAFEFVLGELFQQEWPMNTAGTKHRGDVERWRSIQLERVKNLVEWQVNQLLAKSGSPLSIMKTMRPPHDLFLS